MLKVFVWVIGNKVMNTPNLNVPELNYALLALGLLLVLRIVFVLMKARILKRGRVIELDINSEPVFTVDVCASCGKPVSEKVLNYCRANSKRLNGRIFCYDHQRNV